MSFLDVNNASSLAENISCYAIPYGALGFASHLLTCYTIFAISSNRRPLFPFHITSDKRTTFRLSFYYLNLVLSFGTLFTGIFFALVSIVRCKHHWQLVALAIWRLGVTLFVAMVGMHLAVLAVLNRPPSRHTPAASEEGTLVSTGRRSLSTFFNPEKPIHALYWFFLYLPCMIIGYAGLISILQSSWSILRVRVVTQAFAVALVCLLLCMLFGLWGALSKSGAIHNNPDEVMDHEDGGCRFGRGWRIMIGLFSVLSIFFVDWELGAITGNFGGVPVIPGNEGGGVITWLYWSSERLMMLSL